MPHNDLQSKYQKDNNVTFSFCVILGIDWHAINYYNELHVLYMFCMHFKLSVSVLCCQSVIPK